MTLTLIGGYDFSYRRALERRSCNIICDMEEAVEPPKQNVELEKNRTDKRKFFTQYVIHQTFRMF